MPGSRCRFIFIIPICTKKEKNDYAICRIKRRMEKTVYQ